MSRLPAGSVQKPASFIHLALFGREKVDNWVRVRSPSIHSCCYQTFLSPERGIRNQGMHTARQTHKLGLEALNLVC